MIKSLMLRHVLMNEAGAGDGGAGAAPSPTPVTAAAPSPTPAPAAAPSPSPSVDPSLVPPDSLLGDKPDEGTKPPEEEKKPDETNKPVEPVKYEAFKLPEGMTVDDAKLGEFTKLAGESQVSQDVAQKLLDIYAAEVKQVTEAPYKAWADLQKSWRDEVTNDPEIGGANLEKNLATTKAGLTALLGDEGSKKFFAALSVTGAGSNPDIVRGLMKAAAPHAPATSVLGRPAGSTKSAGETLYPKQTGLGNGHEG